MNRGRLKYFLLPVIFCLLMMVAIPLRGYSQCEPDTIYCIDTEEPGQICPDELADGTVGQEYKQYLTVLAPESGNIGPININIYKLRLESIENLPPGIKFNSEFSEFFPNQAYCVSLSGIPTKTGRYKLKVSVTPFIRFLGIPLAMPVQEDSTSAVLRIKTSTSIISELRDDFSLIEAHPNPFITTTRIGYNDSSPEEAELLVYSLMGELLHRERLSGNAGENYFDFNGEVLPAGYYLYTIIRAREILSGRIIKSR